MTADGCGCATDPRRTNAPRSLITIRAGGRRLVEATWRQDGEVCSDSLEAATSNLARAIANAAANQLAVGERPNLALTNLWPWLALELVEQHVAVQAEHARE